MWTNADAVEEFIEGHKDRRWCAGDSFVLPDIEQTYSVLTVRPFRHRDRFYLYVDIEAQCAVEGCGTYFMATKDVHQWKTNRNLPRCCAAHRYQFKTDMVNAWKTSAEIAAIVPKPPKVKRKPKSRVLGVNELALHRALQHCGLVTDRPSLEDVIQTAVALLDKPQGKRDTRRQVVKRAILQMLGRKALVIEDGCCVLG